MTTCGKLPDASSDKGVTQVIPDIIGRGTHAGQIQRTIRSAQDFDSTYNLVGGNDERLPFMPFQLADFTAILLECVAETNGPNFLDVGAGPGSKMMIAEELFGLTPFGVEIDEDLVLCSPYRDNIVCACALTSDIDYGSYDIIWLYRPFRDPSMEAQLEGKIREQMKPGAILAGGAWELDPPLHWETIVDDWDCRRGAFKKVG